jgi:ElaA protein
MEPGTLHYWVQGDNPDTVASYLRTLVGPESPTVIGRVATHPAYRSRGYGQMLVECVIADAQRPITMHAQAYLEKWYGKMGFVPEGEIFIEEDIEHIAMRLD